mmetsp:Transcript_8591/g.22347  ORF Transcript_8591/g.22347 Transcript_8591/m.22347 type:complete len:206 (+) Transcript_8591:191-808(+)
MRGLCGEVGGRRHRLGRRGPQARVGGGGALLRELALEPHVGPDRHDDLPSQVRLYLVLGLLLPLPRLHPPPARVGQQGDDEHSEGRQVRGVEAPPPPPPPLGRRGGGDPPLRLCQRRDCPLKLDGRGEPEQGLEPRLHHRGPLAPHPLSQHPRRRAVPGKERPLHLGHQRGLAPGGALDGVDLDRPPWEGEGLRENGAPLGRREE